MKLTYNRLLLLSLLIGSSQINKVTAQNTGFCGTDEAQKALYLAHPEIEKSAKEYEEMINQQVKEMAGSYNRANPKLVIPVVFHILHANGPENIPDSDVYAQMETLNREFSQFDASKLEPTFEARAAQVNIEFRLAKKDPNGNCTNGINRVYTQRTFDAHDHSKIVQWPRDKYLNVWVVRNIKNDNSSGTTQGYTYKPGSVQGTGFARDGIMMIYTQCDANGTTLTHEVGHWINLEHTFGSGDITEQVCSDDGIQDTPVTKGHFSTCPATDFSCNLKTLLATFNFSKVTTTSGTTDTTALPAVDSLILTKFKAVGVSANSTTDSAFSFSNWGTGGAAIDNDTTFASLTGSVDNGKYYEFTVTPRESQGMTLTTLTFEFKRNLTGARTFVVRSSVDNFASNIKAAVTPASALLKVRANNTFFAVKDTSAKVVGCQIVMTGTGSPYISLKSAVTFRIYGFNAEDASGTFSIDNVSLAGNYADLQNTQNYMDYSSCRYMFTKQQSDKMRISLQNTIASRSNLIKQSNLEATGTTDADEANPCAGKPIIDFYASTASICATKSITYSAVVSNLRKTGSNPKYSWSFPNGTPSTSTSATPTITYNVEGYHPATLTVTNNGDTVSITKQMIRVYGDYLTTTPGLASENFDNTTAFNQSNWQIVDLENNGKKYSITNKASYSGTQSIMMNAFGNFESDKDLLITPAFDLTYVDNATLTFRCAAATRAAVLTDMTDELKVYSSTDCGQNWQLRKTFTGVTFLNNGYYPTEFTPASASAWAEHTVLIPSTQTTGNVRFRFEYTSSAKSNNIYIDDVKINGTLSTHENSIEKGFVSLYPNPTNQTATVSYHLNNNSKVVIQVLDVLGREIMQINQNSQPEGDYSVQISRDELNLLTGIYFVKVSINDKVTIKRLIISE